MTPADLLHTWLRRQLPHATTQWMDAQRALLADKPGDRELYLAISLVTRKLGKDDLALDAADFEQARSARSNWDPTGWSVDQAGRICLLLSANASPQQFLTWLDQLCQTADVGELIAFYRGLPLYPEQSQYRLRAAEGVRSNMKAVFESVAHRNPYALEQLSEGAWNQMVLKALFVGSALHPIQGLDARSNPTLMRMLCDYAHERWAAKRPVSPELWRCVGPHTDAAALADLEHVIDSGTPPERQAAALALASATMPAAKTLLKRHSDLADAVASGKINWNSVVQPS